MCMIYPCACTCVTCPYPCAYTFGVHFYLCVHIYPCVIFIHVLYVYLRVHIYLCALDWSAGEKDERQQAERTARALGLVSS